MYLPYERSVINVGRRKFLGETLFGKNTPKKIVFFSDKDLFKMTALLYSTVCTVFPHPHELGHSGNFLDLGEYVSKMLLWTEEQYNSYPKRL